MVEVCMCVHEEGVGGGSCELLRWIDVWWW